MKLSIRHTLTLLCIILAWLPVTAWAKPNLVVNIKAEKEVIVKEDGLDVKKVVEVKEVKPKDIVIYTLEVSNTGDEAATSVAIKDKIPPGTTYTQGSASETEELMFSIDGGKTYKKPSLLTYEMKLADGKKEKRVASPEQYTDIQWVIKRLAPGAKLSLHFQVRVQ